MSNQSFSNNPKIPPSSQGGKPQPYPTKPGTKQPANQPQTPESAAEEQLKKILSQLADNNPANIAEIIHMWLNEDKK